MTVSTPTPANYQLHVLQTRPLEASRSSELARALAYLGTELIPLTRYRLTVRRGSLTLQDPHASHRVLKLFFDDAAELPGATPGQLVLGIELTAHKPFEQSSIRDGLAKTFKNQYLDARRPPDTLYLCQLAPTHSGHAYDLVLLDGETEWEPKDLHPIGPDDIDLLKGEIRRAIDSDIPNDGGVSINWPPHFAEYDQRSSISGSQDL
jgi:hypothetical protein